MENISTPGYIKVEQQHAVCGEEQVLQILMLFHRHGYIVFETMLTSRLLSFLSGKFPCGAALTPVGTESTRNEFLDPLLKADRHSRAGRVCSSDMRLGDVSS